MKVTTWVLLDPTLHCDQQQLKDMSSTDVGSPAVQCFLQVNKLCNTYTGGGTKSGWSQKVRGVLGGNAGSFFDGVLTTCASQVQH